MGNIIDFPKPTIKNYPESRLLRTSPARATNTDYLARHQEALRNPRGVERAIVALRAGIMEYGLQYSDRYEDALLGNDGILGDGWLEITRGYLTLLNGECGRLDCGTLDGEVRRWATKFGFQEEL